MMKFLRENKKIILIITTAGFIAGIFIGFGGYFFSRGGITNAVAIVNGTPISFRSYSLLMNRVLDNLREEGKELSEDEIKQKQNEVVQELIQEEVFWQESKKYGIKVTDNEVAMDIASYPAFQREGKFSQQLYFQILSWRIRMTPAEFEDYRRKQIAIAKLRNLITSGVKLTENEIKNEYFLANEGKMNDYEKKKEEFLKELYNKKASAVLLEWYRSLGTNLNVRIFKEHFIYK